MKLENLFGIKTEQILDNFEWKMSRQSKSKKTTHQHQNIMCVETSF